MKQQVTGNILGSALLEQGITIDKDGDEIDPARYYAYVTEHCSIDAMTILSKTQARVSQQRAPRQGSQQVARSEARTTAESPTAESRDAQTLTERVDPIKAMEPNKTVTH